MGSRLVVKKSLKRGLQRVSFRRFPRAIVDRFVARPDHLAITLRVMLPGRTTSSVKSLCFLAAVLRRST